MKPQPKQQIQKAIASGMDEKAKAIIRPEARRISRVIDMVRLPAAGYLFPDCRCPECTKARTK